MIDLMKRIIHVDEAVNDVHCADNRDFMAMMAPESVDCIITDPPYSTGREWTRNGFTFIDRYPSMDDYIDYLRARCNLMHYILKPHGTLYIHVDARVVHHVKVMLDVCFGADNFIQDIIWVRLNKLPDKRVVWRKFHDNILCYQKEKAELRNIINPTGVMVKTRKLKKVDGKITKTDEIIEYEKSQYLTTSVIDDIPNVLTPGFPTSKPVRLYERIVEASTLPGQVVFDPFCGGGSVCIAAALHDRRYIGVDEYPPAVQFSKNRIEEALRQGRLGI